MDRVDIVFLHIVKRGMLQKIGKPHNRIQGSADLVGYVGEEVGLGLAGCLRLVFSDPQFLFPPEVFGHSIEGRSELPDLIPGGDSKFLIQITSHDRPGHLL